MNLTTKHVRFFCLWLSGIFTVFIDIRWLSPLWWHKQRRPSSVSSEVKGFQTKHSKQVEHQEKIHVDRLNKGKHFSIQTQQSLCVCVCPLRYMDVCVRCACVQVLALHECECLCVRVCVCICICTCKCVCVCPVHHLSYVMCEGIITQTWMIGPEWTAVALSSYDIRNTQKHTIHLDFKAALCNCFGERSHVTRHRRAFRPTHGCTRSVR